MLPWLSVVSTIPFMVSLGKTVLLVPAVATQGTVLLVTPSCVVSASSVLVGATAFSGLWGLSRSSQQPKMDL